MTDLYFCSLSCQAPAAASPHLQPTSHAPTHPVTAYFRSLVYSGSR